MKKRIFTLFLALCLLVGLLPLSAAAASKDTKAPVLKSVSVSASKVTAPGKVTVTVKATDNDSGFDYAFARFYCEKQNKTISCYIEKKSSGKYQGTFEVDRYQAAGTFYLDSVTLYDEAGNSVTYAAEPWGNYKQLSSTLQKVKIKVSASKPDTKAPTLKSITLSGTKIKAPGKVKVTMKATDDISGVTDAYAEFYCEKLDETISCYIKKQSNGKFQGTLSVDKWQAAGTFKLVRVTVYDDAGNSATYDKNPWGSQKQLSSKMQALSVKVTATNPDRTDPKLKSISLSATSVKNGGKITVTMKATDDNSGVKSGHAYFYNKELGKYLSCGIYKQSNGKFQGTLNVSETQESGVYELYELSLYDNAGNNTYYDREPYSWSDEKQMTPSVQENKIVVLNGDPVAVKKSVYTESGKTASVSVKGAKSGSTYRWYIKKPGATKFTKTSVTKSTYTAKMSSKTDGTELYCVVKDKKGNTYTTNTVTLLMEATITTQPKTVSVSKGKTAKVTVKAVGEDLTYTWYYKDSGSSKFKVASGVNGTSYSVKMSASTKNRQVYCVVTDKYGHTVQSKTVTLKMK